MSKSERRAVARIPSKSAAEAVAFQPGMTVDELSIYSGWTAAILTRRLNDAAERGWVFAGTARRCSVTGYPSCPWYPGDTPIEDMGAQHGE